MLPLMLCLDCKKLGKKILLEPVDCEEHKKQTGHDSWKMVRRKKNANLVNPEIIKR